MPQLDQVTFFSQFFWLFLIFITFYILILKNFLPPLSRIFKFRKKKIDHSQQGVFKAKAQRNKIGKTVDTLVERAGNGLQNLYQTNLQAIHSWLYNIFLECNKTEWKEIHPHYLSYLGENSLSRNLAVDFGLERIDETRFLLLLMEEINKNLTIQT
jgi:hypothetical protein